jgi:hypothetical protein
LAFRISTNAFLFVLLCCFFETGFCQVAQPVVELAM